MEIIVPKIANGFLCRNNTKTNKHHTKFVENSRFRRLRRRKNERSRYAGHTQQVAEKAEITDGEMAQRLQAEATKNKE